MHEDFTRLRLLVLSAGELARPPWWPTQFLTPTGQRFLERLYPRTTLSAAINASTLAACRVHDRSIGVGPQ
ncbi:MAG: BrxE family protein [Candidatus Eisenbacteria bacterium]|nr:BrxE family protein [Candidatus Eisenbacteria bacterium]